MPRTGRIVIENIPYHITQRGNRGCEVFKDDEDRHRYFASVVKFSLKHQLQILAFCIMNNHVHFVVIPKKNDSLEKTFRALNVSYTKYFVRKYGKSGFVWQGRYYSCMLDEKHLIAACRYVERNPVRANLVLQPWNWEWSSAPIHVDEEIDIKSELNKMFDYIDFTPKEWKNFIDESDKDEFKGLIKKHTKNGKPFGTSEFIEKLKNQFGIVIQNKKAGRPFS